ncbi:MAG: hypothetical protein LBB23_01955 [Rickettsiales bacterium]|nr:hypothetical protein [Rickettsiales bacterium]
MTKYPGLPPTLRYGATSRRDDDDKMFGWGSGDPHPLSIDHYPGTSCHPFASEGICAINKNSTTLRPAGAPLQLGGEFYSAGSRGQAPG